MTANKFCAGDAPSDDCDTMSISIVVLSHNRDDVIEDNLRGLLLAAVDVHAQVIVVDNGSTDKSRAIIQQLREEYPWLETVFLEQNRGVAAGRNAGIGCARANVVLSLDDDATISAESIMRALDLFERMPNLGSLAPRVVHALTGQEQGYVGSDLDEIANFHGAGHFLRREAFSKVGGYDDYCTFGGEELDLSIRMRSLGFSTVFTNTILVLHNSRIHLGEVAMDRRLKWAQSHAYVFAKSFSLSYAVLLVSRRLVSSIISYRRAKGTLGLSGPSFGYYQATAQGFRDGRAACAIVSKEARRFYQRPSVAPEFGNRPLLKKAVSRISARTPS